MNGTWPTDRSRSRRSGATAPCTCQGSFRSELVERLAAGVERDLAEPGPLAITMEPADGSGRFVEDFCRWSEIPEYRDVVEQSGMGAAAPS